MAIDIAALLQQLGIDPSTLGQQAEDRGTLQLQQIEDQFNLGQDQLKNQLRIAQMSSRNQQDATAATRKYQQGQLGLGQDTLAATREYQQGQLGLGRDTLAATREYQQGQLALGQDTLAATREYQRGQLAQAQAEMERVGIPDMEIRQFTAQKNYEIAKGELDLKQQNFGLDAAKYGSQLESQPDSYFQARRYQAFEAPRLLGADTSSNQVYGGPTPQISTIGARLSGQDPYASGATTPVASGAAGPDGISGTPDDRAQTLTSIVKASPPSPYDGLDAQDAATLHLMQTVYQKGFNQIPRGELERQQANGSIGFLKSAGTALGYDPNAAIADYQAYAPTQAAGNLA